jgi:hypothetical protein
MFTSLLKLIYPRIAFWFWAWGLVIFVLCATPGEYIPSNNWLELLSVDKLVHASIFCTLSFFGLLWLHKKNKSQFNYLCVAVCSTYGIVLEVMQATLFRNRSADYRDMVANTFGCLAALWVLKRLLPKLSTFR